MEDKKLSLLEKETLECIEHLAACIRAGTCSIGSFDAEARPFSEGITRSTFNIAFTQGSHFIVRVED